MWSRRTASLGRWSRRRRSRTLGSVLFPTTAFYCYVFIVSSTKSTSIFELLKAS